MGAQVVYGDQYMKKKATNETTRVRDTSAGKKARRLGAAESGALHASRNGEATISFG